jgi:hypothetical protein
MGWAIRKLPFTHLIVLLPSREPMLAVASDKNDARLPLSLIKRIVEHAPAEAFFPSKDRVRMSAGAFIDLLEEFECEAMPLRSRYAVIDAQCVGWAAAVFTFGGDVTLEADEATVALAYKRGEESSFARSRASMQIAVRASEISGRPLSRPA